MSVEEWDLDAEPPVRASGPSSFPGFPLFRAAEGSYLAAYMPSNWQDETVLLSVGSSSSGYALAEARASRGAASPRLATGTMALKAAGPTADSVAVADIAELSGWGATLAASPDDGPAPRLVAATSSEALICAADSGSLIAGSRVALPAGGWNTTGFAFGGDWLYAASGYSGVTRWPR